MKLSDDEFRQVVRYANDALDIELSHMRRAEAAGALADQVIKALIQVRESFFDPKNGAEMERFVRDAVKLAALSASSEPSIVSLVAVARDLVGEVNSP